MSLLGLLLAAIVVYVFSSWSTFRWLLNMRISTVLQPVTPQLKELAQQWMDTWHSSCIPWLVLPVSYFRPRSQYLAHISHSYPFLWGNFVPIGPSLRRRVMELLCRCLTFNNDFLCSRTCHDISVMPSLSFNFIYSLFASERSRQFESLSANDFAYPTCWDI